MCGISSNDLNVTEYLIQCVRNGEWLAIGEFQLRVCKNGVSEHYQNPNFHAKSSLFEVLGTAIRCQGQTMTLEEYPKVACSRGATSAAIFSEDKSDASDSRHFAPPSKL